jgi:hypothetical protein
MFKRISPATIIVLVAALFVVLTSTATAAKLITGAQIKNGSIGLVDLSAKAKKALRGKQGPQGLPGAQGAPGTPGAPGAPGAQGPAGGFDPSKVMYVKGDAVVVGPEEFGSVTATCPGGNRAISGGWLVQSEGDVTEVDGSHPNDDGTSWTVVVYNWDMDLAVTVTPFAICASR